MEQKEVRALLEQVSSGELDIDEAMLKLKEAPFEDLGFAKPDYHRALRQGIGEVIYGQRYCSPHSVRLSGRELER